MTHKQGAINNTAEIAEVVRLMSGQLKIRSKHRAGPPMNAGGKTCSGLSSDGEVAHHHAIPVLEVVTVKQIALAAGEAGVFRQCEIDRQPHRLVRP